jgi:hypothetical protein
LTRANHNIDLANAASNCPASAPCHPHAVWNDCLASGLIDAAESSAASRSNSFSPSIPNRCSLGDYKFQYYASPGGPNDTAAAAAVQPPVCPVGATNPLAVPQFAAVWGVAPDGYASLLMLCALSKQA